MLGDPATELLEQLSRWPARDAYEMQQKEKVLAYARAVVAENERLRALVVAVIDAEDSGELCAAIEAGVAEVGPTEIRTVRRK